MSLKGMTWDHPRGVDPLLAANRAAAEEGLAIEVTWDRRSLQDFEHYPLEDLARRYDLIVMDHPHVGDAIASGAIVAVEDLLAPDEIAALQADTLKVVWDSYVEDGRTWALPIDAATQVMIWRPGRLKGAPTSWEDLLSLARQGRVLLPLKSPHALMSLFSLMANLGCPFPQAGQPDVAMLRDALAHLAALAAHVPDVCYTLDPIAVHEALAAGGEADCAPLIYGYSYYGLDGVRPHRLRFADMSGPLGAAGTTLGGTGLAISRYGSDPKSAARIAARIAGADWQTRIVAPAGGQPSSLAAQRDDTVNVRVGGFWKDTARTLETAWVRPRHPRYVKFQEPGSNIVARYLRGDAGANETVRDLTEAFRASFGSTD